MNGILERIKSMLLGTDFEEDIDDEYSRKDFDDRDEEESEPVRGYARAAAKEPKERASEIDYIGSRRSAKGSKILNFQNPNTATETQVIITYPTDVQDATLICDHVRENKTCVVNLEGVPREKAQRIADFLGGAAFALSGEIQRISNEIFVIAPASVHISGDLKEELKSESHSFSWASSFK